MCEHTREAYSALEVVDVPLEWTGLQRRLQCCDTHTQTHTYYILSTSSPLYNPAVVFVSVEHVINVINP